MAFMSAKEEFLSAQLTIKLFFSTVISHLDRDFQQLPIYWQPWFKKKQNRVFMVN